MSFLMSYETKRNYEMTTGRMVWLTILMLLLLIGGFLFVLESEQPRAPSITYYTYSTVNTYPHDPDAFTEGLVFQNGFLYESTGLYGNSSLRQEDLETGKTLQIHMLQTQYFGEGIAIVGDDIVQLTWREHVGFVYDKTSFNLLREFNYSTEGWGLTYDGSQLIMSDGTAHLYFMDPNTFEITGNVTVHDKAPVTNLNELEYIKGQVYANIWETTRIAIINPQTGNVTGWIDMNGIQDLKNPNPENVLNGIAYDSNNNRLFITGKMWSHIYQIKLIPSS